MAAATTFMFRAYYDLVSYKNKSRMLLMINVSNRNIYFFHAIAVQVLLSKRPGGGRGHNMFWIRVKGMCHPYGWVFGPKFSKNKGGISGRVSINMGGVSTGCQKIVKNR